MLINKVPMLVTNTAMRKGQDNSDYCAIGVLSLDDGQKYDVTVRDPEVYFQLKPMTKVVLNLELTSSKYGLKLSIRDLIEIGSTI
jgi:hypothetical protein